VSVAEHDPPSLLEWWAIAALSLGVAFVIGLTQPGVSRPPPGVPTFVALSLTILACSLEAAAVARRLAARRYGWLRTTAAFVAFLALIAAGVALIGRAPGREVLFAWIVVPPAIGIAAVAAAGRRGSWSAVAFLIVTGLLVVVLGRRWIGA
jgi:lysylphosphatidylglycerol synthetase-like protein (DUF2156 family)